MGKLAIILYFILPVFPADANETRRHIHIVKRGYITFYLTDGREIISPVGLFPEIKKLSLAQREDYMIMDDQYFSFEAISKIYSVKDILCC